jgi:murein DD-endopeptidase MepM/ murein hydrolase activator NlpD
MSELRLVRLLKLGARGKDVRAMKRGLARAGHGRLAASFNPFFDPFVQRHLKDFQHKAGLSPDGVYGEHSHRALIPWFDKFAQQLYEQAADEVWEPKGQEQQQAPAGSVSLPQDFVPTHETAGLPGFRAIDVFGKPGATVLAPEDGVIARFSGRDPGQGGSPGGPYGWSIYLDAPSGRYFMTHFGSRSVSVGQRVKRGETLGTVCDSAVSGKPGTSHIHLGKARW